MIVLPTPAATTTHHPHHSSTATTNSPRCPVLMLPPPPTHTCTHTLSQVTRERIRQIEAKAIRQLRARQLQPGTVIADYQNADMGGPKSLAARTSSGTKKQG